MTRDLDGDWQGTGDWDRLQKSAATPQLAPAEAERKPDAPPPSLARRIWRVVYESLHHQDPERVIADIERELGDDDWITTGFGRIDGRWVELGHSIGVRCEPPASQPELPVHEVADRLNAMEELTAERLAEVESERDRQSDALVVASAEVQSLIAICDQLREALKAVEWEYIRDGAITGTPYHCCPNPRCWRSKAEGHAPDCIVGKSLGRMA